MDNKENVSFPALSSLFAILITLFFIVLRSPFETDYEVILKIVTTSLFFINTPFCLLLFLEKRKAIDFYSFTIFAVLALLLLVAIAGALGMSIGYAIVMLGTVAAGFTTYFYARAFALKKIITLILALLFCMWLAGVVWEGRMLTPLFLEKILTGFYNNPSDLNYGLDNLYHMSFAQMIKTYNVPSTGLDELPYIPYHYGSHFLFASISTAIGIGVPDIYNLGFPVIFLPLFFYICFLVFHQFKEAAGDLGKFDFFFWVLLFTVFAGFLPMEPSGYAYRTGLAWNSIIKSESYLISLTFLIACLPFLILPFLTKKSQPVSLVQIGVFACLLVLIGFTKISTLYILDVIICYIYVRCKLYSSVKGNAILFLAITISLVLAYYLHDPNGPGGSFSFLHFYKEFIYSRFHFFIALYFLWTLALISMYILLRLRNVTVNFILLELQIVIAIIGFLPGMLLRVEGGSAHYFSDIQHWTAFFFIGYLFPGLIKSVKPAGLKVLYAIAFLALILCSINSLYSFERALKDNYITKQRLLGKIIDNVDLVTTQELLRNRSDLFNPELNVRLREINDFQRFSYLFSLDTIRNKEERILFIQDEKILLEYAPCYKFPFLLTAATGMALVNGFSLDDCFWGGYGVEYYTDKRNISNIEDPCDLIKDPIFTTVVSYDFNNHSYHTIKCDK